MPENEEMDPVVWAKTFMFQLQRMDMEINEATMSQWFAQALTTGQNAGWAACRKAQQDELQNRKK